MAKPKEPVPPEATTSTEIPVEKPKPVEGLPVYEARAVRKCVATGDGTFNPMTRGEEIERFAMGNLGLSYREFLLMGTIIAGQLGAFNEMPLNQILSAVYYLGCYDGARLTMAQLTLDMGDGKEGKAN